MSQHFADWDERALDLAVLHATDGLNHENQAELSSLVESRDLEEFEHAVAALHLAQLTDIEAPPVEFARRLEQMGRQLLQSPETSSAWKRDAVPSAPPIPRSLEAVPRRSTALRWSGWWVAAALMLTIGLSRWSSDSNLSASRAQLIANASDLLRVDWTPTQDPAAVRANGDVVWSSGRQEGYMLFDGLAPNDPAESQYQLWIFDKSRADWEAKPVDGGVFDVPADGNVLVPIDPKLFVSDAVLFAITVEVPGGVVVSERERLVLTASPR